MVIYEQNEAQEFFNTLAMYEWYAQNVLLLTAMLVWTVKVATLCGSNRHSYTFNAILSREKIDNICWGAASSDSSAGGYLHMQLAEKQNKTPKDIIK